MRQSTHRVDELAVVSRIEGASPGDLTFVLRSPGGQCIALPAPEPVEGIIRLHADASNVDLSPMLGWQPHGEWRLELRGGPCAQPGPALDCLAGSFSPALAPRSLAVGTYCVVVDGDLSDGSGRAALGRFNLFTTVDAPWVRPAEPVAAARCDAPPAPPREIACGQGVVRHEHRTTLRDP